MSLTPAQDEVERRKKIDAVEKCGKNMGPHHFMPIETTQTDNVIRVTRLLCSVCYCNVSTKMLLSNYPEVSL